MKILKNLDLAISCVAMAALVIYTFTGVVMRYVVGNPITWGEEFQITCMVIIVFFAAGAGFRMGNHVAIDFVVDKLPVVPRKVVAAFIAAVTLFILIYLLKQSLALVEQMHRTGRSTDILQIPYYLIYSAFPIGCVLMIVNFIISTAKTLMSKEG